MNLKPIYSILFLIVFSQFTWAQEQPSETFVSPEIKASRTSNEIILDGVLDEKDWETAAVISGFKQVEPYQGTAAKNETEVKILFDDKNIYFGVFSHSENGKKSIRVPSLTRDFSFDDNDLFGICIDAFNSKRNAVAFQITPYGNQRDLQSFDDVLFDEDWDALWHAKTTIVENGWYAEIAIPFNSIRFPEATSDWRINFIRIHRKSNEISAFPGYPRSLDTYRMSYSAILKGIEPPKAGKNLRLNPYVLGLTDVVEANGTTSDEFTAKIGGDIKWAVTPHAALDVTINTDFAQADVDRQVVNLTRFSVYFPERRQFFLENSGMFLVGDGENIEPFFSRRIGLDDNGNPIPLLVGAKYTDRTIKRSLGALYVLQDSYDSIPNTHFSTLRYMHNYGGANNVGVLLTNKYASSEQVNTVASVSGLHRSGENWQFKYLFSHSTDKNHSNSVSGFGGNFNLDYASNNMFFSSNHSLISKSYLPGIGFVSRGNLLTHNTGIIPIIRPKWKPKFIRSFQPGVFVSASQQASDLSMQEGAISTYPCYLIFNDGSLLAFRHRYNWQLLTEDLDILDYTIGKGDYYYNSYRLEYNSDLSKKISVASAFELGKYFNGGLKSYSAELKIAPIPHVSLMGSYEYNAITDFGVDKQDFDTNLFTSTLRLALNPNVQLETFYQYNSTLKNSRINARFSWQYKPLSFIYLVFNSNEMAGVREYQGIFKINFLTQIN